MAILVIEDNLNHFKELHDFVHAGMLHSCSPDSDQENTAFISSIKIWLAKGKWTENAHSLSKYLERDYDVILLDMELDSHMGVLSGKKVLESIRKNEKNKYTPVLILTSSEFEEVDECFKHKDFFANYYMNKSLNGKVLSGDFLEKRLRPVLHMLINWKAVAFSNADAHHTMLIQLDEISKMIKAESGLLIAKIDDVINEIATSKDEIVMLSKIHLRIVQAQVKKNDPRLNKLIDKFVANFSAYDFTEFPEVQSSRDQIAEFFFKSKDELKKILEKGVEDKVKDEFMDYVEEKVKEIAGCDPDSSLTVAMAKIIYRTVGQTWEFINFKT